MTRRTVVILLLFSLSIRLALVGAFWHSGKGPALRDYENGDIARNLVAGKGFSSGPGYLLSEEGRPTAHKPPVYPLLLAGALLLFPRSPYLPVQILQSILIALGSAFLLMGLGRVFDRRTALWAVLLLNVSPFFLNSHLMIEAVSLAFFLYALLIYFLLRAAQEPGLAVRWSALAGLTAAAAIQTNAGIIFFIPFAAWWLWRQEGHVHRAPAVGWFLAVFLLGILPWTVRNGAVFGRLVPIRSSGGMELWIGNNPRANGGLVTHDGTPVLAEPPAEMREKLQGLNEVERNDVAAREALRFIRENPGRALWLRVLSFTDFWVPQVYWLEYNRSARNWAALGLTALMMIFAALGALRSIRRWVPYGGILFGLLAAHCLPYVLTHGDVSTRYRLPLDGFILAYAAYFLVSSTEKRKVFVSSSL